MQYDDLLDIALGMSASSRIWKNERWKWSTLVKKLTTEHKTYETYSQYIKATKDEQSKIKDVGGYVGGYLRAGRRKPEHVVHRQILTLDIDFAHVNFWDDFCLQFENSGVIHATHKYSPESPRFRLIMPLNREVTPDEYVAIARYVAGILGIELFDNTTFETNRLMFWPSNPKDVDYYCESQDGPWLDADKVLGSYVDWTDSSLWPTAERTLKNVKDATAKQADPDAKKGVVGAFCRAYTIEQTIEKFLSDVYTPASDGRYTYQSGTTSAGLMIYEDRFAYSHHGTDPCSGRLCNAFDLVRIHKFGHLDKISEHGNSGSKSYKAMEEFARGDVETKKLIAAEKFADSKYDFAEELTPEMENIIEEATEWASELEVDTRGRYLSSATNLNIIFANDIHLKGLFRQNDFDGKRYAFSSLPWRTISEPEPMKNVDYSGVRNYIETIYGISGNLKIDDALALEFERYSFHPIREYLSDLEWDSEPRVDNMLLDYFGAEDTIFVREAIRKTMVGAVARIFEPGIKFDLVLTLVGAQGTGKSTLIAKLGRGWSSDTFMTVHGKEAFEQLQGAWLVEMAELAGLRKAEVESIKHFISKQEDMFRPAYARASETYPRQCVFFGTTNNKDFLRDPSGNRRFIPVGINPKTAKKSVFSKEFDETIDQFWAEAVHLFKQGEKLYMSKEAEKLAYVEQSKHSEVDERKGLVIEYLETLLPEDWDELDIFARRTFLNDPLSGKGKVERDYVCVAEIWCECLSKAKEDMSRYNTRDLNDILRGLDGWEESKSTKNFSLYGKQKYYAKTLD